MRPKPPAGPSRIPPDYELAISQVRDYAIFMLDANGRAASWNEGVLRVLGWSEADWLGQPIEVIYPEATVHEAARELQTARERGHASDDRWLRCKSGRSFFAAGITTSICRNRKHVGFLKVLRDQTRQHEQARRLAQEQARLHLALDAANAYAWEWDLESDRVRQSGAHALFGSTDVAFDEFLKLVPAEDRGGIREACARAVSGDGNYSVEFRVARPGTGMRWMSSRGRVQTGRDGRRRLIGIAADVTAFREIEDELRAADRRKDDFLATLAHELRNPLAPIRTGLEIIRRARGNEEMLEGARAIMERQLGYVVHLIDDLMDISRITRGKLELRRESLTLSAVIDSAVEMARGAIESEGHALTLELPVQPVRLTGDRTRLAQVFANLLINAAKYTEPGGRIHLRAMGQGTHVEVSVTDTGIGLSREALEEVFDMYSQGQRRKEVPQGLGIGLALVRGLVELHEGTIRAVSAGPGKGSTFTVRLPLARASGHRPGAAEALAHASGSSRRVLVVDDNADAAESIATFLRLSGHEVSTARDGFHALELAEKAHPEVVLLDIGMPHMDGLEVARRLRERPWARNTVLLAMTGWGQDSDRERSREAGIAHHLVKPVDPIALEELLSGRGAGNPR